jgi:hypothetical protein
MTDKGGTTMTTTKVRFTATIEVDVQEWAEAYGMVPTARAVQQDVRNAVLDHIQNMAVAPASVTAR